MDAEVWVNGVFSDANHAVMPVLDRGLMLGDALFETLRARNSLPEFFTEHYNRLLNSAKELKISLNYEQKELKEVIQALCKKGNFADASIRITLTRGVWTGSMGIDLNAEPTLIVVAFPVHRPPEELFKKGVSLYMDSSIISSISGNVHKTTSYLSNILLREEAVKRGFYDAIMCGLHGEITEMTTANLFFVRNGVIETPKLESGVLPGITRHKIIEILKKNKIEVLEKDLFPRDLIRVEEAFLASSVRGIMPISCVNEYEFTGTRSIYAQLNSEYEKLAVQSLKMVELTNY